MRTVVCDGSEFFLRRDETVKRCIRQGSPARFFTTRCLEHSTLLSLTFRRFCGSLDVDS